MMMSSAAMSSMTMSMSSSLLENTTFGGSSSSIPIITPSSSMTMPLHKQSPSDSSAKHCSQVHSIVPNGRPPVSLPGGLASLPKKPLRPLTAYHIFFQVEREYVIQTMDGAVADPSMHDGKEYLADVPRRYKSILLAPDWYAGPGKRKKRKHRKQHGKIGFLELSRVISSRWASLAEKEPEVKEFVQGIAKRELDVYYEEMKVYKELTKDMMPAEKEKMEPKKKSSKKRAISDSSNVVSRSNSSSTMPQRPEMVSSYQPMNTMPLLKNDIDHFLRCIDDNSQHLLPQRIPQNDMPMKRKSNFNTDFCNSGFNKHFNRQESGMSLSQFDPILAVSSFMEPSRKKTKRVSDPDACMSPTGVEDVMFPKSAEVDICDEEIMNLWKSHN